MSGMGGKKKYIICDLDGTIAFDEHRNHFLHNQEGIRDWDAYFAACEGDEPNHAMIEILRKIHAWDHNFNRQGYIIYILSGRNTSTRTQTEAWLAKHNVPWNELVMRGEKDRTQDSELKPRWAEELGLTPENVLVVFEDRQRVVDAWRTLGYTVFQVAPGAF